MIDGKRALAIVPARGGSKAVPRKNLRDVGGRPLIAWTIAAARAARAVDHVIVSSEDPEILDVARAHGADTPFVRDRALAGDDALTIDVTLDALTRCPGFDWVILLQPTSPLRTAADIDAAAALCERRAAPSCVSVAAAAESPYWMYRVDDDDHMAPLIPDAPIARRQDLPPVYHLNGAVYIANAEWLAGTRTFLTGDTVAYVMPSGRSLDIDTEDDLHRADAALRA